jgi:hypothetical protein
MRAVMLGYWVILVGVVLDIVGTICDVIDPLTGEEAMGGLLSPEILKFLEAVMNSIRNGLGMRKTRIAKTTGRSWNPHFYGVHTQVHNTL